MSQYKIQKTKQRNQTNNIHFSQHFSAVAMLFLLTTSFAVVNLGLLVRAAMPLSASKTLVKTATGTEWQIAQTTVNLKQKYGNFGTPKAPNEQILPKLPVLEKANLKVAGLDADNWFLQSKLLANDNLQVEVLNLPSLAKKCKMTLSPDYNSQLSIVSESKDVATGGCKFEISKKNLYWNSMQILLEIQNEQSQPIAQKSLQYLTNSPSGF